MGTKSETVAPREGVPTVSLLGLRLARVEWQWLVRHVFASLREGRGGWLVTANLDFLRRYVREPAARALYDAAEIRVADGMPLVWACRIQGDGIPERIPGSSFVWSLVEGAAQEGRSLYLLGGAPGACGRAGKVMLARYPSLKLCGCSSPMIDSPPTPSQVESIVAELSKIRPDILMVGMGSPKQEQLIRILRDHLPSTWMIGVGISFSFMAGDLKRAPEWMSDLGLEWVHRLFQDPRRLAKRYLVDDIPFAMHLFPHALRVRVSRLFGMGDSL